MSVWVFIFGIVYRLWLVLLFLTTACITYYHHTLHSWTYAALLPNFRDIRTVS